MRRLKSNYNKNSRPEHSRARNRRHLPLIYAAMHEDGVNGVNWWRKPDDKGKDVHSSDLVLSSQTTLSTKAELIIILNKIGLGLWFLPYLFSMASWRPTIGANTLDKPCFIHFSPRRLLYLSLWAWAHCPPCCLTLLLPSSATFYFSFSSWPHFVASLIVFRGNHSLSTYRSWYLDIYSHKWQYLSRRTTICCSNVEKVNRKQKNKAGR